MFVRVLRQSQVNARGQYLLLVDDDLCVRLAVVDIPQCLQELEGEKEIDVPVLDKR